MRINKYLASAGLGSRRKVEEFIKNGKVKVNGVVITNFATDISENDSVVVNGKKISSTSKYVYYKLHKPKGYVTTVSDDKDRKTVIDLMRGVHERVFPVGRLDYDSEGLLILTNDGELTNILTKPSSKVEKTYVVHIESSITQDEIKKLSSGVDIGGYITKPCSVQPIEIKENLSKLKVTISEGKNRQIRKMFATIGKNITLLRRVQIGEIKLGGLSRGEYNKLNSKELKYIFGLKK